MVRPIWDELLQLINDNLHADYTLDNFDLMFGVSDDSLVTFLILCCKFYIYRCKYQEVSPNFVAFKRFLLTKRKQSIVLCIKKGNCPTILRNGLLIFKYLYNLCMPMYFLTLAVPVYLIVLFCDYL